MIRGKRERGRKGGREGHRQTDTSPASGQRCLGVCLTWPAPWLQVQHLRMEDLCEHLRVTEWLTKTDMSLDVPLLELLTLVKSLALFLHKTRQCR